MVAPSLLLEWMIARAERFINAVLQHAYDIDTLLQPLRDKPIRFMFKPIEVSLVMTIQGNQVVLSTDDRPALLTLSATPIQFLSTLLTQSVSDLHMEGDVKLAQQLQRTVQGMNIDIEAFLETLVGGTLAHILLERAKRIATSASNIMTHGKQDLSDYCHYEIQATASQAECDQFAKDVNAMRYAVDHLVARVQQLQRQVEVPHAE